MRSASASTGSMNRRSIQVEAMLTAMLPMTIPVSVEKADAPSIMPPIATPQLTASSEAGARRRTERSLNSMRRRASRSAIEENSLQDAPDGPHPQPLSRSLREQARGAHGLAQTDLFRLPLACGRRPRERGLGGEGQIHPSRSLIQ